MKPTATPNARPLLDVQDLHVAYPQRQGGWNEVVRGVSLTLGRERVALVGESGSGKSQTGRAILGLTPPQARVRARHLALQDQDLLALPPAERRRRCGRDMAMILQDPRFSLNPVMRLGDQILETLQTHRPQPARQAREQVLEALAAVQIDRPERVARLFPHEVSGGMGQRVMIAMMLIARPQLLIADEPTSALDVSVQLEVLALLDDLVGRLGMGLLFISHDLRLVSSFCDRVLVMYAGRIVESLPASALHEARHPYTRGLLDCLPRLGQTRRPLPTLSRDPAWLR
ncbi:ABC transporter ATP-binding protein [Amphibiibacter pelophylacis]|uniref:ABC transporter ATP-binding protein n=1 Tax=Amphibiibacter pelophylacis TaxID=1799477 RepID=A0ACC6P3W9_9BURK